MRKIHSKSHPSEDSSSSLETIAALVSAFEDFIYLGDFVLLLLKFTLRFKVGFKG